MVILLACLSGCDVPASQTGGQYVAQYVAMISGGRVVQVVRVKDVRYGISSLGVTLPDGKSMEWHGEYLISDVPIEAAEQILYLQGG